MEAREPLSAKQLRALFPNLGALDLASYLPPLNAACREFSITTPQRVAMFVAQLGHESLGLTRWTESFDYKPSRLLMTFPKLGTLERAAALVEQEKNAAGAIAEAVYGGRADLGNDQPGDGARYIGRGPHQLTGKDNYRGHGDVLGEDLVAQPELVAKPFIGFRSAGLFFLAKGLVEISDRDSLDAFRLQTRKLNGALNGWEDRVKRYREARAVLGLPPISEAA